MEKSEDSKKMLVNIEKAIDSGDLFLSKILFVYFEKKYPLIIKDQNSVDYKEFIRLLNEYHLLINETNILSSEDIFKNYQTLPYNVAPHIEPYNEISNFLNNETKSEEKIFITDQSCKKESFRKASSNKVLSSVDVSNLFSENELSYLDSSKMWVVTYTNTEEFNKILVKLNDLLKANEANQIILLIHVNDDNFVDILFNALIFLYGNSNISLSSLKIHKVNPIKVAKEVYDLISKNDRDFGAEHIRNFNLNSYNKVPELKIRKKTNSIKLEKGGNAKIELTQDESKFIKECMITDEESIRKLKILYQILNSDLPILLLGETGVGKTFFAKKFHEHSSRKENPFQDLNCAAIPLDLIDAELFGAKGGAYTSLGKDKKGIIEAAEGGTLFLDEITEAPTELQAKLLKFVESNEYYRVGDSNARKADVRIIYATNRKISSNADANAFRKDFYYRISQFSIEIPPLRERKDLIKSLVTSFKTSNSKNYNFENISVSEEALKTLYEKNWPGNIRQLNNTLMRSFFDCKANKLIEINSNIIDRNYEEFTSPGSLEEFENTLDNYFNFWNENKNKVIEIIKSERNYKESLINYIDGFLKPILAELYINKYEKTCKKKDVFGVIGMNWDSSTPQIKEKQKLYPRIKELFE